MLRYPTPAPEFRLWRLDAAAGPLPDPELGRIVLAIDPVMITDGDRIELGRGDAAFVPAGSAATVACDGVGFVAAPGV